MSSALQDAIKKGLLRDGVTSYSNVEPVQAARQILVNSYVFPYVGELPIWTNGGIQWTVQFENNAASKNLWFYSLVFIDYLVKAAVLEADDIYWEKAIELYRSYKKWREQDKNSKSLLFRDEHAVTNRACVFSQLLHCVLNRATDNEDLILLVQDIVDELIEHGDWLALDEHYVFNNHGIMMDRALLNLVVQFRSYNSERFSEKNDLWLNKSLERLNMMLHRVFDKDGCCTENSPSYHMLNMSLFGAIDSFIRNNNLSIEKNEINVVLKQVIEASSYMFHEDGTLPLVGDSEERPSVFVPDGFYKDKFGFGFFPDAGFCFVKEPGFYLTFKCGGTSFSHRHIDDTSITLRIDGLDFICDGGMYSYDYNDPIRKFLMSSRGHSGFFTEQNSATLFSNYSSAKEMARMLDVKIFSPFLQLEGESQIDKQALINRKITALKNENAKYTALLIDDSFDSTVEKGWRIQFLLHPDVNLIVENDKAILNRGNVALLVSFNTTEKYKLVIEDGYFSKKYQMVDKCKVLVAIGSSMSANISTLISVRYLD
ncbi:heparinase II/III family protein [Rheinheimera soli]|uniref:Heparinase II/III-like C-terminal domain-containing protein n=1 Tax=Rheinheimera soli TaxID=443616 RepID=A0ABU1VUD3_9GAMM|nr:heparinase II/III family protein [Rheinheimera soli]MDR7119314.1 hypothetical protein [Rheinheimera soli]